MIDFIIQEEIKVSKEWVDKVIEKYEKMPNRFRLMFGEFEGNQKDIIKEIREMSEVGKKILLMDYEFEKFMEKKS